MGSTDNGIDYKQVTELIDQAFIALDNGGLIVDHNAQATTKQFGKGRRISRGARFTTYLPEKYRVRVDDMITHAATTEEPLIIEFEDNRRLTKGCYEMRVYPQPNCQVYILIRDVTFRKILERRANASAADMAAILESANALIFGIDTLGYITEWNSRSEMTTGIDKSTAYAQSFSDLLLPEPEKEHFHEVVTAVLKGAPVSAFELRVKGKDGQHLLLLMSVTPRRTTTGQVVGMVFIGENIAMSNQE